MLKTAVTSAQFWSQMLELVPDSWWEDADTLIRESQPLREKAKFNTGSISRTTAVALRAISAWRQPDIVVEIGTFIGVSARTLARGTARFVITCDISNDCLDTNSVIRTHPYTKSTDLLKKLAKDGGTVDLFFFDGLLSPEDAMLVRELSTPDTVYVFDDFNGEFKGVHNVRKLQPLLPCHVLMSADGWVRADTTLGVLVHEARL